MKPIVKSTWIAITLLLIADVLLFLNYETKLFEAICMTVLIVICIVFNIVFSKMTAKGFEFKHTFSFRRIVLYTLYISGLIFILAGLYTVVDLAPFIVISVGCIMFAIPCLFSIRD